MTATNRIDDMETGIAIESPLKVELKPSSLGSRATSPSAAGPYYLKSYQTHHRAATLLNPPSAKTHKTVAEARDELISDLIGPDAKSPVSKYVPEPDTLTTGRPQESALSGADVVTLGARESSPKHAVKPPPRAQAHVQPHRIKARALNYPLAFYSISLNMASITIIFFLLYLIMQIPGVTQVNSLEIYISLRMEMLPIPMWLNSGCIILSIIFVVRILLYHVKYALGLVIGIPVSLSTVLSYHMEGFVGNGIVLGFCISAAGLLCLIMEAKARLKPEDTTMISMVTGLSIVPLVGHVIHFFAALVIGLTVGLSAQIVLLLYVTLHRHRYPSITKREPGAHGDRRIAVKK